MQSEIGSHFYREYEFEFWGQFSSTWYQINVYTLFFLVTGIFPPPAPRKVPGSAKYAVDANLFRLEPSILLRAKRATNWNNVGTEKLGEGGIFREEVYLESFFFSNGQGHILVASTSGEFFKIFGGYLFSVTLSIGKLIRIYYERFH